MTAKHDFGTPLERAKIIAALVLNGECTLGDLKRVTKIQTEQLKPVLFRMLEAGMVERDRVNETYLFSLPAIAAE